MAPLPRPLWRPLGVILGSFLNVVAHRLPRQLDRESRAWARDLLGLDPDAEVEQSPYNLAWPPSTARAAKAPKVVLIFPS